MLVAWLALLVAGSWLRWGNPVSDPGLDLVVARDWLDGVLPYRDVRYWYGPLGIGGLAATFALLGSSLAAAFAFGALQTLAITALSWALARRWLAPWPAAGAVGVVLAIGFSGSLFNFQLPHTAAATTGLIALLAVLLALAAGRPSLAGVAVGLAALTRPEFLAFALVAVAGAALGSWRERRGSRAAVRLVLATLPGTLLVAVPVLGCFAAQAGAERLFTENLFPIDFVRAAGTQFEQGWHPYDLVSLGGLLLRGVLVGGAALALLRSVEAWQGARGAGLSGGRAVRLAAGPWLVWAAVLALAAAVSVLLGLAQGEPLAAMGEVGDDIARLLIAMTALPAIAFAALVVAAGRWWWREPSPLGGSWPGDAALLATAAACALRAYDEFSTDVYATYYAPPAVLVAAILLWRGAARLGSAGGAGGSGARGVPAGGGPAGDGVAARAGGAGGGRTATLVVTGVLGLGALSLALHAYVGRYADQTVRVSSPHGSYRASEAAGPQIQGVVEHLAPRVRPGEPMLVLPQEPGFHFLLGTRPALYDATFLPGTLHDEQADRAAAIALLRRPPRYVIVASRRFEQWGFRRSGDDFNRQLHAALAARYCVDATFGAVGAPPASDLPAEAFTVLRLREAVPAGSELTLALRAAKATPAPAPRAC